jgi:thymidylate synthase ThyX
MTDLSPAAQAVLDGFRAVPTLMDGPSIAGALRAAADQVVPNDYDPPRTPIYPEAQGCPEEQARGVLPFDYRQHFVVSFNLRSLLHFFDTRAKLDAQLEIRQLCELMWPHVKAWVPEIAAWYEAKRWGRGRLAP